MIDFRTLNALLDTRANVVNSQQINYDIMKECDKKILELIENIEVN